MKKMLWLGTALMLAAGQVLAGGETAFSRMPGACPPALPIQVAPQLDAGQLPGARPRMAGLILGGVAGNLAGAIGLGFAGSLIRYTGEALIPPGTIVGVPVGSVFGSALGVCLAGNTRYWRGRFGSALLGSAMGLLSAFLVSALLPEAFQELGVVYFSVLPPLGAAVFFNATLDRRFASAQGALFNLSRGDVAMSVPDIQLRPLFVPGSDARPGLQFKVRILSVEL